MIPDLARDIRVMLDAAWHLPAPKAASHTV